MNIKKSFSTMTTAVLLVATLAVAGAAVTVNADGTGFVGKGDVQLAFGWNDHVLQANAAGVSFTYDSTDLYSGVCTFTTGEGTRGEQTHNVAHTKKTVVNSAVAYEVRKNPQIKVTGWNLNGFGASTEGAIPEVGGACVGFPGNGATWVSVELVSSSGGLFVHYGAQSVLLQ